MWHPGPLPRPAASTRFLFLLHIIQLLPVAGKWAQHYVMSSVANGLAHYMQSHASHRRLSRTGHRPLPLPPLLLHVHLGLGQRVLVACFG